jgi:hypothetical protein
VEGETGRGDSPSELVADCSLMEAPMKVILLPLLPTVMLTASGAGVSAQSLAAAPLSDSYAPIVLAADKSKPAPKTTPPPLQFQIDPQPLASSMTPILIQPRYTMPIAEHDFSLYPMPVTPGKGQPVRMPLVKPAQSR